MLGPEWDWGLAGKPNPVPRCAQRAQLRFYGSGWAVFAAGYAQYLGTAGTLTGTEYDFGLHWLAITVGAWARMGLGFSRQA